MPSRTKQTVPDDENPEWTKADFAHSVRLDGLPIGLRDKLEKHARGRQKAPTKVAISIRLSKDVVEELRGTGAGWQSRVDDALRSWLKRRTIAEGPAASGRDA